MTLHDALTENLFSEDEYIRRKRPRSVFCLPLVKQRKLVGVLYLENNLAPGVFTPNGLAILELIASQAAISLEQARLYDHAKPTVISVNLRCEPPNLVLEVTDNGSGVADSQAASREGFGFSNMRARVKKLKGTLDIRTAPGRGTSIVVSVPVNG